jgi:hypothetical protein
MRLHWVTPFFTALACALLAAGTAVAGPISTPLPSKAERAAKRVVLKKKRKLIRAKIAIRKERKSKRKLFLQPPVILAEPVVSADAFEAVFETQVERKIRRQKRELTRTRESVERARERARRLEEQRLASVPSAGDIVSIGRWIQSLGYEVSEHSAFGGVCDCHSGTDHYAGKALDVNDYSGSEMTRLDALHAQLEPLMRAGYVKGVLWRTEGHYDHLHVAVP